MEKRKISPLIIIEAVILAFGVFLSIQATVKPLRFTTKYIWCFVFPLLGIGMILFLLLRLRKKFTSLIGIGLILLYLFAAGYGYFICELNYSRLNKISFFEGKEVKIVYDDTEYKWDGESVTYERNGLINIESGEMKITLDGEDIRYGVLRKPEDDNLYLEIYGGGTGIFLKLDAYHGDVSYHK